ncbi:3-ketoacyl-CoA synthase 1 [Citrus sinensis]|uniref:3-ketoacyl-CoA synthase 1 n=1 Tax=Citrus sinensis TaxID=2711 RepID=A0ACB8IQA6_CITSI|nr:3-ketoacyl-CoA synthase 1 [Citrus sinensis]
MGTRATAVQLPGLELNRMAELQLPAVSTTLIILLFAVLFWSKHSRTVYLVDFSCYKPDDELKASVDKFLKVTENRGLFQEDSFHFQKPYSIQSHLFSSMIVNRYKLRTDIKTCNLGGMGFSASLLSVELAWTLLKGKPNSYTVVVSTEKIAHSWYSGKNLSVLLTNCLFRMGAPALLSSNKARDRSRPKYELTHLVRTRTGSNDKHFNCVRLAQDDEGKVGVSLSKEVMFVAGDALKTNITTLGP